MSLAALTVWSSGQVLTAQALDNEFGTIYNNPIALVYPLVSTVDDNNKQHANFRVENLTSDPVAGINPGRIWFNSGSGTWNGDNGTAAVIIGPSTSTSGGSGGGGGGGSAGSKVLGLVGAVTANTATFTAAEINLRSTVITNGTFPVTCTSGLSINSQTPGSAAGGRDTAGAFLSTYVHFYAISTGSGSTGCVGIVSTKVPQQGGPTLPTGYSAWAYLASAAYDFNTSAMKYNHLVRGAQSFFSTFTNVVNSTAGAVETIASLAGIVPDNCLTFTLAHRGSGANAASDPYHARFDVRAVSGVGFHEDEVQISAPGVNATHLLNSRIEVPNVNAIPAFYWLTNDVTGNGSKTVIDLKAWKNPNGDA